MNSTQQETCPEDVIPRGIGIALIATGFAAVALSTLVTTTISMVSTGNTPPNWIPVSVATIGISVALFVAAHSIRD